MTRISSQKHRRRWVMRQLFVNSWVALLVMFVLLTVGEDSVQANTIQQLIPILGTTIGASRAGEVVYLIVSFEERADHGGLAVQFKRGQGRFSPMVQTSVQEGIYRAAYALGVSPDSWTVIVSLPYPGLTLYGHSCSAMVALTVVALAKGVIIPPDRVITGTVTPDGHIGMVGAVPLKVTAAYQAHLRRVLVPEEQDEEDGDFETPFLMQISPVATVTQAYQALTDFPITP
jgi:predicted S18 family serine protease